jgi:hypothetical protein
MAPQRFRFLTIKCPDYKATQALVQRARYDGSLYFVNWHKNQVQIFERVKVAPENPALDRVENAINRAKQLTLNLTEA